ncbi:hypothetical protein Goshw_007673 [Gossypium schwendimanii]|uniref:Uncharacterized protein n=1 Tax=Gossypium schwendimanii TaxID=34291 RepID=A0A7J9LVX8_GOSSC|nr:hypothetical protein [Gossypium schwendimanii]
MALDLVLAKLTRVLLLRSHSCEVYASSPEGYSRELSLQTSSIPVMSSADYAYRRTFFFRVGFIRSMSMGDLISIHPSELKFPCKFSFASLAFLLF